MAGRLFLPVNAAEGELTDFDFDIGYLSQRSEDRPAKRRTGAAPVVECDLQPNGFRQPAAVQRLKLAFEVSATREYSRL